MQDHQGALAQISVDGNANVVAGRDVIQIITERPKFTVYVNRDDGHISDAQAATLKRLVRDIVERLAERQRPPTFSHVWRTLNDEMRVPSYRLTPAARFGAAESFLMQWRDST